MNANKGFLNRARKELKNIQQTRPHGIQVSLPSDSLQVWEAVIDGPELYKGGKFKIQIYLPETYPLLPPSVRFLTPIYHLNAQPQSGQVCIGALSEENWLPTRCVEDVLRAVFSLMIKPAAETAADHDILGIFNTNRELYKSNARKSAQNAK